MMARVAEEAGFRNVKGIDEASAAIHTVMVQKEGDLQTIVNSQNTGHLNILMVDMGAGTTDLALCRYAMGSGNVEILNTWPKEHGALFGGREIDEALWGYIKRYLADCGFNAITDERPYLSQSKAWKEGNVSALLKKGRPVANCAFVSSFFVNMGGNQKPFPAIDRSVFEKMLAGYLKQFPDLLNALLYNTPGIAHGDVDLVVLTGGHSQWYFADEILQGTMTAFGEVNLPKIKADPSRIIRLARPQETVALGLTYQPMSVKIKVGEAKRESKAKDRVRQPDLERDTVVSFSMYIDQVIETENLSIIGRIHKGSVSVGDTLIVYSDTKDFLPARATVCGIIELVDTEESANIINSASAGERVGLLIKGIERGMINHGDSVFKTNEGTKNDETGNYTTYSTPYGTFTAENKKTHTPGAPTTQKDVEQFAAELMRSITNKHLMTNLVPCSATVALQNVITSGKYNINADEIPIFAYACLGNPYKDLATGSFNESAIGTGFVLTTKAIYYYPGLAQDAAYIMKIPYDELRTVDYSNSRMSGYKVIINLQKNGKEIRLNTLTAKDTPIILAAVIIKTRDRFK